MRELYATELSSETDRNEAARSYVDVWVNRHIGGNGSSAAASVVENDDGSCTITLLQVDEAAGLEWRSDVSPGSPSALARVTVRVRLGSLGGGAIAPIDYEFGTPAIVRTLLRELDIRDGSVPCAADLGAEVGPSGVSDLVSLLTDDDRAWPVVVVSRSEPSGATLLDAGKLCRELAGLAHVRVLSSAATSWELTNSIGKEYSVWRGAVRVFFTGFSGEGDDFRRHRVTFPDRVDEATVARLRTWLGTLAAAATQDHPAVRLQREQRRALVLAAVESNDAAELREWIGILEEDNGKLTQDAEDYKQQAAELRKQLGRIESELEQVRDNFAEMQRSMEPPPTSESEGVEADGWPASVAQAMDAVEELAATGYYKRGVVLNPAAVRAGRRFDNYARPEELLRACQAVLEAGIQYHENTLGMSPGQYFNGRGFGYAAQPSPHLKVDESTSPDQCLRIYWTEDPTSRVWTITSIGEHD
jgi:hypothetical protein